MPANGCHFTTSRYSKVIALHTYASSYGHYTNKIYTCNYAQMRIIYDWLLTLDVRSGSLNLFLHRASTSCVSAILCSVDLYCYCCAMAIPSENTHQRILLVHPVSSSLQFWNDLEPFPALVIVYCLISCSHNSEDRKLKEFTLYVLLC